jgi:hypothetical protein
MMIVVLERERGTPADTQRGRFAGFQSIDVNGYATQVYYY